MTFGDYAFLVWSDLYRITGEIRFTQLIHEVLLGEGFKFNFWLRTCSWMRTHRTLRYTTLPFAVWMLNWQRYKLLISISPRTEIGSGLYIGHFAGIFINADCRIGKNCNISQGVTLGPTNRGERKGCPVIGDNVYIGPGAKVVGRVVIGNDVAIGANCVVTKDVPDHAVVVGVPGRVISSRGSEAYVERTDYETRLHRRVADPRT